MKAIFNIAKNIRNSRSISALGALRKLQSLGLLLCALMIGSLQVWGAAATLPVDYTFGDNSYPTGCTGNSLTLQGYAASHGNYRLKFDGTGDYLQIQTDAAAQQIIFSVKMIGGNSNSSFQITGSADGSSYSNVGSAFTISGSTNDIVNCTTSVSINSTYRYFRLVFTKGSNVGFGTLKISKAAPSTFTVTIAKNQNTWGTVSANSVGSVANNTSISAAGNVLTVGASTVTATPTAQDADYNYAFSNWTGIPGSGKVTADVTVTANFTRAERTLTNYRTLCSVTCDDKYCINSYKDGGNGMTCFTDQGSNVWTISNYAIPATGQTDRKDQNDFWVGYDGAWVGGKSYNWHFRWIPFKNLACGTYKLGAAAQAVGTLTINAATAGSDNNYELTFDPNGYGFCYGTDPSWETPLAFTRQGVTNIWNTSIVNVSDVISHNYYVGLSKLGGGYVFSSDYDYDDDDEHIDGISEIQTISGMGVASDVTANPVTFRVGGLSSSDGASGMRGYFQIWTDNCNRNFYCHFVPVYTITYKSYDGLSTLYTEQVSAGESFIVRAAETGSVGWAESSGQSAASGNYVVGNSYVPTGNVTLYVAMTAYTVSYTATSGTIQRDAVTISSDVVVAGNSVTLPTVTGSSLTCARFLGWYAGDYNNSSKPAFLAAGASYEPTGDVTLKALYAIVGDNYELVTSPSSLVVGSQVVFAYRECDHDFDPDPYFMTAMSETQAANNRGVYDYTSSKVTTNSSGTTIAWTEDAPDVAEFTVEAGSSNGTYAFYAETVYDANGDAADPGYIYCASGSSNGYLRTKSDKDALGSWTITISNGEATMESGSAQTRRYLWYNPTNDVFCCYADNYNNNGGKKPSIFQRSVSNYTTSPACTTYNVSLCSPGHGTISASPTTVTPGGYTTLTFTPATNYMLDAVTVTSGTATPADPVYSSGPTSAGTVRINSISSDITVCATFKAIPLYTVTFVDVDNSNATQTRTQGSYGANITTPSTSSSSAHDPCDNTWSFVGWAPSNTLSGGTTEPTGFIAAGGTIDGAIIDGPKTYYSVYTNSSDGTTAFTQGKSGTYYFKAITTTPTTVYATGAIDGSGRYPTNNATKVPFLITYNSVTSKYTIKNTLTDKYVAPTADGVGYTNNLQEQAGAFEWGLTEVTKYYASYGTNAEAVTGEWLFTYVNKSSNTRAIYYDSYFKALGYPDYDSYALYLEPATSIYYYNASSCTDLVTMTFHPIAGGDPTWADGHPKAEYTDVAKGTISVFPTDAQEGWTFLGWTAGQSYNDNREDAGETLDDDNASTTEPSQTIYSTGGNSYNLQADIDMYPVFTKFADNDPFDQINGGDYYIYYVADGDIATSQDAYGGNNRIYASGRSNNAYEVTSNCNNAALFTFTKLLNGKWTIYDNKNSGSGGKHYVCGEQTGSGNDLTLQATATAANYGEWTITVVSGNQVQMTCFDDYMLQANSTNATSGSIKNYASNNYSSDPGHYHRVYLGTCTERVYSSDPTNNPRVSINGNIKVTSTAGVSVKATNALTVSANNISTSNITITSNNSAFKFSDSASGSYSASLNISVVNKKVGITPIYVEYTPAAGSTSDGIDDAIITVSDGAGTPTTASTSAGDVQGRHLPAKFLIATKVGDDWYALPNNISGYGNPAAVKLSSVNEGTGVATYYSDQYDGEAVGSKNYLTWTLNTLVSTNNADYGYPQHGNRVRFYDSKSSKYLEGKASDDDIKNSIASPTASDHPLCEFLPTTSDLVDYTLKNEGQVKYLGVDGSTWGLYTGLTTVRFLIPNQQPAPTITWQNDMLGSQHAQNTAENGVVTLPTGADPVSCNTTLYPTFCGWSATQPTGSGGYWSSAPSYITNGTAATENTTYYAVFKHESNNWWRTTCPTIYTLTFNRGTGTGDDYVVYTENSTYTMPDAATTGHTKAGYTLSGWTASAAVTVGGKPVAAGEFIAVGADVSGISTDVTFTAVWAGNISVTSAVRLTSFNGVTVYTTSNPDNNITISTTSIAGATGIKLTYYDSNDNPIDPTNSKFRLCYVSNTAYAPSVADGTAQNTRLSELTLNERVYSNTYVISYTPNSYGTSGITDTYKLKVELMRNSTTLSEATLMMYGRALPQNFVIAAKSTMDNQWYALPANLSTSSGGTTKTPYLIKVDNTSAPTKATYAPANALLTGASRYAAGTNTGGIRLKSTTTQITEEAVTKDAYVTAPNSADASYLYLTTGNSTHQDWYLTSSDFSQYTVQINPTQSNARSMKINSGVIGYYNTGNAVMYILPVETSTVTIASAVEWGKNSLIVEAAKPSGATKVQGTIGETSSAVIALETTNTSVKGSTTQYNFTMNFGEALDFSAHNGDVLVIDWKNDGGTTLSSSVISIPRIIATNTTMSGTGASWQTDVHVLPGVTLTAATYVSNRIRNLEVYPSAKVLIPDGVTLYVQNLSLHAGWTRASGKLYDVARVYISSTGSLDKSNAYLDWYIDYDQYYPIAVPFPASITDKPYKNAAGLSYNGNVLLRYYDGAGRASSGQAQLGQNWKKYGDDGNKAYPRILDPSKGYAMTAKRPTGRAFSIIRMPLTFDNIWTTNGEKGVINETTHKDTVYVEAYGVGTESAWYAQGWNFVANPYMAVFSGSGDELNGKLQQQNGGEVRYATIPDIDFKNFDQKPIASAELKPASGFFIQVGTTGYVQFAASHRQQAKASILSAKNQNTESEAYIELNGNGGNDMMGLLISDEYTDGYDINADLAKVLGETNALKTYMTYGGTDMAYVAISENSAKAWIPVTVKIPAAGEYTFTMSDASLVDELEGIYLIDYSNNQTTNLINNDYTFSAEAGTISGRFAINGIVGEKLPTTVDDIGGDNDGPQKFIYHQKMYILNNGVIYDAVGKKVREINK